MSLLIKALQRVERKPVAESDKHVFLEKSGPMAFSVEDKAESNTGDESGKTMQQTAAGLVFSAKRPAGSVTRAFQIAGAGLLVLTLAGAGFYFYLNRLQQPEMVGTHAVNPNSLPEPAVQSAPVAGDNTKSETEGSAAGTSQEASTTDHRDAENREIKDPDVAAHGVDQSMLTDAKPLIADKQRNLSESKTDENSVVRMQRLQRNHPSFQVGSPESAVSSGASVKVTRNTTINGVNPVLLSAYQAFEAGDNATAQQLYRRVIQTDERNVDALLGLAAIASRQQRNRDAAGWYGKVLEVEPGNAIAQSAIMGAMNENDEAGKESRLKNLLAQQPESAGLHAALGDIYAEQNQWTSAQQAYFQAHHFEPENASYVYNLAVSLDQMGKAQLALQYYRQTLTLLANSTTSGIDKIQLEHRIEQLQ